MPHPLEGLPARGKAPASKRILDSWIMAAQERSGVGERLSWLVASMVVVATRPSEWGQIGGVGRHNLVAIGGAQEERRIDDVARRTPSKECSGPPAQLLVECDDFDAGDRPGQSGLAQNGGIGQGTSSRPYGGCQPRHDHQCRIESDPARAIAPLVGDETSGVIDQSHATPPRITTARSRSRRSWRATSSSVISPKSAS
jgi:hypothetical protein